jgi:hypothetical protein
LEATAYSKGALFTTKYCRSVLFQSLQRLLQVARVNEKVLITFAAPRSRFADGLERRKIDENAQ